MSPGHCLETYSRDEVVAYYAAYTDLQKPEAGILAQLGSRLAGMRMLELGVGGGRITEHYAPRVAEYRAVDLAPKMVELCRRRFRGRIPEDRFSVGDMRSLEGYGARSFDLVFISYNTIDHLALAERAELLAHARRVIAPRGYFCFSSHNVGCLGRWLSLANWLGAEFWLHPRSGLRRLRQRTRLRELNRAALEQQAGADYVPINNGTHDDLGLRNYYVRPGAQARDLRAAGFGRVRVFSLDSGEEIDVRAAEVAADRWFYYLAS